MPRRRSEEQLVREVWKRAPEYYTDLAYHNFGGHILDTIDESKQLLPELKEKGVEVNEAEVTAALLLHDARFHLDHKKAGFETKEAYSAFLARELLELLGANEDFILGVETDILATHHLATPETNEAKVVRLLDVSNVYRGLWGFAKNGLLLAKEAGQLGNHLAETHDAFWAGSAAFLEFYFGKPLVFINSEGQTVTLDKQYLNARRNLELAARLGKLPAQKLGRFVVGAAEIIPDRWVRN